MTSKYPESVEAHVKELRWEFHTALAATKGIRTKRPVPEHVSNLIRSGIRKGIAEGLSQGKCDNFPSKQAQKEVEDLIHSQISSELYGQLHDTLSPDVVPRTMLKSVHASFAELSHKYATQAANFATNVQLPAANGHTAPASPAETVLKMEDGSGSPPNWEGGQDDMVLSKDENHPMNINIVVSGADRKVDPSMIDRELTDLVNQSIGSDPEIPSQLSDSEWITGAKVIDTGAIEVHVESEDDREFLTSNAHWRPVLEQALAARNKVYALPMNANQPELIRSMALAHEASAITRTAHNQDCQWEQDIIDTTELLPVIMPSSRPGQASRAIDRGTVWEARRHVLRTLPYNDQPNEHPTKGLVQPHLPFQATEVTEMADNTLNTELAAPKFGRQPASTESDFEHKRRGECISGALPCSDNTTKRRRLTMHGQ